MPPDMTPRLQPGLGSTLADPTGAPLPEPVGVARTRRAELLAAITGLERVLAVPARDPTWAARVEAAIAALATAFDHHIAATEGSDGMYAEILRSAPRLDFAVNRLVLEHADARASIAALGKLSAELGGSDLGGIERVRDEGTELLAKLVRHRQRGADLVFEAYAHDIGGCD
jgi:hypothetical protein